MLLPQDLQLWHEVLAQRPIASKGQLPRQRLRAAWRAAAHGNKLVCGTDPSDEHAAA